MMKRSYKRPLRNHEPPASCSETSEKAGVVYLRPKDISSRKAAKILERLNSFESAEQLKDAVHKRAKQTVLTPRDAQNIINSKAELREFQDLQQVAAVRRIGAKKFDSIVRALG